MRGIRIRTAFVSLVAAATVTLLATASAGAHKATFPTTVEILGFGASVPGGPTDYLWGRVSSTKPNCVKARTMTLKREISGQPFTVDTATTSQRGFFAVGGDDIELGGFVLVDKQRLGKKNKAHKHTCAGATEVFNP
jgi:hypothetical protein